MNVVPDVDGAVPRIAAAIGEPARARMLYCLMDDRARTSTELAAVAQVSPSTASAHLDRLKRAGLVAMCAQGKHRFYRLESSGVATLLEGLSVLAGGPSSEFTPTTPDHLRTARTCYDHLAGTLGVALHDRLIVLEWLTTEPAGKDDSYQLTAKGAKALDALGIDVDAIRNARRRLAFACLDWSERRSHLGGAIGAALLTLALRKKWVARERDSRAVRVTAVGERELAANFGLRA